MVNYNVTREIKDLNKILRSDFTYKENLQALGKFLFDNLPEVEEILRATKNTFEKGEEIQVSVVRLRRDIIIYEDGKILTTMGSEAIKTNFDLYMMLSKINQDLEQAAELSKNLKKICKVFRKDVKK